VQQLSRSLVSSKSHAPMRVWRHLRDGDYVMVNRQPTLHRPSIMAHKVKVLKKQKTIRMHYANCNSYVGPLVLPTYHGATYVVPSVLVVQCDRHQQPLKRNPAG
jgi:hypothetical protein